MIKEGRETTERIKKKRKRRRTGKQKKIQDGQKILFTDMESISARGRLNEMDEAENDT